MLVKIYPNTIGAGKEKAMKNFALGSIFASLVFAFLGKSALAQDQFLANPETGCGYFDLDCQGQAAAPSQTPGSKAKIAIKNDERHPEEAVEQPSNDTGADEPGDMSEGESEVFGGPSMISEDIKDDISRCRQFSGYFQTLINRYCMVGTKIQVATACGVWKREGRPNMCLGGTRGERCEVSSAGAEGPFQCMPGTAKAMLRGRPYNPQMLEDSAECGIHYLCNLEKQVGDNNMFFAYQSGPGGDFSRENPQVYNRTVRKFISLFSNAGDLSSPTLAATLGIPPIDSGLAYISSSYGDYRVSHPDVPHQGQDWMANPETPVKAAFASTVSFAGWSKSTSGKRCGGQVAFALGNGEVGSLGRIVFCHLSKVVVTTGQKVGAGQVVGYVGARGDGLSGITTASPHLHWETHIVVSRTVTGGRVMVKTVPYSIPAKWFDFSPYVPYPLGHPERNPRYRGPTTPEILRSAIRKWL